LTLKIVLIVLTPIALGVLAALYIVGAYALCQRLQLRTNGPWFATGVVASFVTLLYLIAQRL
jgi:hypothetical protein